MRYFFQRLKMRIIWSWAGVAHAYAEEYSFRCWVWANVVSGGLALWLPLSSGERGLVLALGILVMGFELLNTALERVVDLISPQQHPLAKAAKDSGSGAVAVAAIAVAVAWGLVLIRLAMG